MDENQVVQPVVMQPVIKQADFENFTEMSDEQRFLEGMTAEKGLKEFDRHWTHIERLTEEWKETPLLKKVNKTAEVPAQPVEDESKLGMKERRRRRKERARQEAEKERTEKEKKRIHLTAVEIISQNIDEKPQDLHEEFSAQTGFPDLHFYSKSSYEALIMLQKDIRKGQEGYLKNKAVVDRIFSDAVKYLQMFDRLSQIMGASALAQFADEVVNSPDHAALQKEIEHETNKLLARSLTISNRIEALHGCIRYLTRNEEVDGISMQLLAEYTKDAAFEEQKKQNIEDARAFLDITKAEEERKETKEEKDKRLAAVCKELMTVDEQALSVYARNPEKQVGMVNFAIAADELLRLSSEEKKKLFVKPEGSDLSDEAFIAIMESKLEVMRSYGKIARARLILRAVMSSDSIPPQELMTDEELDNYLTGYEAGSVADILCAFARDMIAEAYAELETPDRKLLTSMDVLKYLTEVGPESKLKDECFSLNKDNLQQYYDLIDEKGAVLKAQHDEEVKARQAEGKEEKKKEPPFDARNEGAKAIYREACEKLADKKWVEENPDEAKRQEEIRRNVEIVVGVSMRNLTIPGEKAAFLPEPFARSFIASQQYDSFRSMKDEEYVDMMSKVAAGAFLDEKSSEEEIAKAKALQKEGIEKYYEKTLEHYDMLEQRFGYEIPSLGYIVEHLGEIQTFSANTQVDLNMITADKTVLTLRNADHEKLIHLVNFYSAYFQWILGMWMDVRGDMGTYSAITDERERKSILENMYEKMKNNLEQNKKTFLKDFKVEKDLDWLRNIGTRRRRDKEKARKQMN